MADRADERGGHPDDPRPVTPALLESAARGEEDAWRALFDDHYPRVYRFYRGYVATNELAAQLAGDVFTEAFRSIEHLPSNGASFEVSLFAIARTILVHGGGVTTQPGVGVTHPLIRDEFLAPEILGPLRTLGAAWRAALELRFVVGLSEPEAAAAMGCSPASFRALEVEALRAFEAASAGERESGAQFQPQRGSAA